MWIDELRQALVRGEQRSQAWPPRERVIDGGVYRRIVVEAIDAAAAREEEIAATSSVPRAPNPAQVRQRLVERWLVESTGRDWLFQVDRRLRDLDLLPTAEVPTWLERILRAGIAHRSLEATSTTELVIEGTIDVWSAPKAFEPDSLGYLHVMQLLRDGLTTSLGRVLLRLEGRDALRWLLLTELLQSTGPEDPHRLSQATVEHLLDQPQDTIWDARYDGDGGREFPHAWSTLERLSRLNLLWLDPEPTRRAYRLWPEGAAVLKEVVSAEFPMRAVAGALLEQDAVSLLSDRRYRAGADRRAADWVVETMAHGLRNALGPVSFALDELSAATPQVAREPAFARVGNGLSRSMKLIEDLVTLYDSARSDAEPFDVASALRDVVDLANGAGVVLDAEATQGVRLVGQRLRFVHALVDTIRNARRHARADQPVRIRLSTARDARALRVIVDDSGTGVPAEIRARIFETGFSTHAEGTGQGLSLLTEVVRGDHQGTIAVGDSPLGGARFVLTIPLEEET